MGSQTSWVCHKATKIAFLIQSIISNVGGICERYQNIQGQLKSLNSGIVTVINYGARVPDLVSHITFRYFSRLYFYLYLIVRSLEGSYFLKIFFKPFPRSDRKIAPF